MGEEWSPSIINTINPSPNAASARWSFFLQAADPAAETQQGNRTKES